MTILENRHLRVVVDTEHGAEITFLGAPDGANALARHDWIAPAPGDRCASHHDTQHDWLSRYRGGWQELFPNAGAESEVLGTPVAFHGEASMTSWEVISTEATACELEVPARLPLVLRRRMTLAADRPLLRLEETVRNESDLSVPYLWGHHPAFPALPGGRIELPDCEVRAEPLLADGLSGEAGTWPYLRDADGGERRLDQIGEGPRQRLLYATGLGAGWAVLRQPGGQPSVELAWDLAAFPVAWLWLQTGTEEFPWFGRARVLTIEPQTAQPFDGLAAAHGRGEAHVLGPSETRSAWLELGLAADE
jgi:galactose mutarotase-like enzyme